MATRCSLTDEALGQLFDKLDTDNSGFLELQEVVDGCDHLFLRREPLSSRLRVRRADGRPHSTAAARDFLDRADANSDGRISKAEFIAAVRAHEDELWSVFVALRSGDDGDFRSVLAPYFSDTRQRDHFAHIALKTLQPDGDELTFARFQAWIGVYRLQTLEHSLDLYRTLDTGHEHSVETGPAEAQTPAGADGWWHVLRVGGAGMLAGVVSRTATAPMERLKIMLATGQLSGASLPELRGGLAGLVRAEGVWGLWRGNLANCLKVGPAKALKFLSFEAALDAVARDAASPTAAETLLVSCLTAAAAATATHPLDTAKTMLAAGATPPSIGQLLARIWREQGVRGLTAGLAPSLASTVPFIGVSMATFQTGKRAFNEASGLPPLAKPPIPVMLGLGILATIAAEGVAYPMYVVKTNAQSDLIHASGGGGGGGAAGGGRGGGSVARGALQTAADIVRARGPLGLYRGVSIAVVKSMPAAMITYTVYETVKAWK